jgi:hypothetical protein
LNKFVTDFCIEKYNLSTRELQLSDLKTRESRYIEYAKINSKENLSTLNFIQDEIKKIEKSIERVNNDPKFVDEYNVYCVEDSKKRSEDIESISFIVNKEYLKLQKLFELNQTNDAN